MKIVSHRGDEELTISENDLEQERKEIAEVFLRNWRGSGTVIIRNDKEVFKKEVARLLSMTRDYQDALKTQLDLEKANFGTKIVKEFFEIWKDSPPKHLKRRGNMSEKRYIQDLERDADGMFDKAVILMCPMPRGPTPRMSTRTVPLRTLRTKN